MVNENIIENLKPQLIMLGFKNHTENYTGLYGVDKTNIIFLHNDGWKLKFYTQANYIDLLNQEDNFGKRIPIGKTSLKLIIKAIEEQDNDS